MSLRRAPWMAPLAAIASMVLAAPSHADTPPSAWDVARDPAAADRWALHVRVQRMIFPVGEEGSSAMDDELRLQVARNMLEEVDAAHGSDLRLRVDLGLVYVKIADSDQRLDLYEKAIDLLAPVVEKAPDQEDMREVLHELSSAYMHLDRPRDEIATWRRLLARSLEDRFRILPLMNMGEAQMRMGRLAEARDTFDEAIRLGQAVLNSSTANLALALLEWDMAVLLDRSGDPARALDTAKKAEEWSWAQVVGAGPLQTARTLNGWDAIRDSKTVFFVPEWERDWYLALGYGAAARAAADPRDAAKLWAEAEAHWTTYIDGASTPTTRPGHGHESHESDPRWLAIARVRRERARAERLDRERRAARLPPRPAPPITSWSDP